MPLFDSKTAEHIIRVGREIRAQHAVSTSATLLTTASARPTFIAKRKLTLGGTGVITRQQRRAMERASR